MADLQSYIWMRQQWRLFRRILLGALTGILVVCASGLVFLRGSGEEEGAPEWFYARVALLFLLATATLVTMWLYVKATLEIRSLGQLAAEARLEEARAGREKDARGKKRRQSG